jgi:hypothetical protein
MTMIFKVICINDSNKPNDIPNNQWIKQGHIYTVTKILKLKIQGDKIGFLLAEVNLDGCAPWLAYASERFGIITSIIVNEDMAWAEKELNRLLEEAEEEEKYSNVKD